MKRSLLAGVAMLALGYVAPAAAGNIVLTGHDDDFHYGLGYDTGAGGNAPDAGGAGPQLAADVAFARAGSTLPVLAIDTGSELTSALTKLGIPYTAVTPSAVTAGMFNHSTYSAFVVASVSTCGGCDNPVGTGTKLAAFSTAIASFFDAGGGIVGLAGATDPNAYAYLPDSAGTPTAIYSSSGFTSTAAGTSNIPGFVAVNGDETHNTFSTPGTGGVSAVYQVAEAFTYDGGMGSATTIFVNNGTIACTGTKCTISGGGGGTTTMPEPTSIALIGAGLFGLAVARRRYYRQG